MLFKKLFANSKTRHEERKAELYRNFIRHEAKIGGELFGPVPKGTRREFFALDEHTWIWHEEWVDANGQQQIKTTRYDVRPDGILKAQDGHGYQRATTAEIKNLCMAARIYQKRVREELYKFAI